MSTKYKNVIQDICEKHKGDETGDIGKDEKDWDYIWKATVEGTDINYETKAVLPPKDKMIAVYAGIRKECWKGSLCNEENRKKIGECVEKTGTEGVMAALGDDYIEKNMNDANCKLFKDYYDAEGSKKMDAFVKKVIEEYDPVKVRKGT